MVHSYGYKPSGNCKNSDGMTFEYAEDITEEVFGGELEIDGGRNQSAVAEALTDACEDIYCKHDGSLSEEGVEIVSYPATLRYHLDKLGWDKICKIALDQGYLSDKARTCGLHIHVGRHQMGSTDAERQEVAGKIVIIVSRLWDEMVKFSRRRESQLEEWAACPMPEWPKVREDCLRAALRTRDEGRYQAVNLCNYNTVEFRLYNGTLNINTLKASFQLTSNIVKYAMRHTVDECIDAQWGDVVAVETFPELTTYLESRGLLEVQTKMPVVFEYETFEEYRVFLETEEAKRNEAYMNQVRQFAVGDVVEVVNRSGWGVGNIRNMMGWRGVITYIPEFADDSSPAIEVNFHGNEGRYGFTHLHSGRGHDTLSYYNVHPQNIRLVEDVLPFRTPSEDEMDDMELAFA